MISWNFGGSSLASIIIKTWRIIVCVSISACNLCCLARGADRYILLALQLPQVHPVGPECRLVICRRSSMKCVALAVGECVDRSKNLEQKELHLRDRKWTATGSSICSFFFCWSKSFFLSAVWVWSLAGSAKKSKVSASSEKTFIWIFKSVGNLLKWTRLKCNQLNERRSVFIGCSLASIKVSSLRQFFKKILGRCAIRFWFLSNWQNEMLRL